MTSNSEQHPHIRLSLGLLARNLLVEEYPLAEQYLQQEEGSERWILDVDVANYAGAARFVVGLMDDIRIIDSSEFENYLTSYIERFWPQAISK
jgi:hypothetical protein